MERIFNLTINLILAPEHYEVSLHTFLRDGYPIPIDCDTLDGFALINGGMEFIKERIYSFYYSVGSYNTLDAAYLLAESIHFIKNDNFEAFAFSTVHENGNSISLKIENHPMQISVNKAQEKVIITYNQGISSINDDRNNPYFHAFELDINTWIGAATIALKEYYKIIEDFFPEALLSDTENSIFKLYKKVVV